MQEIKSSIKVPPFSEALSENVIYRLLDNIICHGAELENNNNNNTNNGKSSSDITVLRQNIRCRTNFTTDNFNKINNSNKKQQQQQATAIAATT